MVGYGGGGGEGEVQLIVDLIVMEMSVSFSLPPSCSMRKIPSYRMDTTLSVHQNYLDVMMKREILLLQETEPQSSIPILV
jgi:hypothetical protein